MRREMKRIAWLRRRSLISVLAVVCLTGFAAMGWHGTEPASPGQATAAQSRPNVVVVMSDDQTLESMKVMDNVNSLIGDQGVTFTNSFVNFSLCCPSRATFLTGQYAHNHRVLTNKPPDGGYQRFESLHAHNNLAVWLRQAGYYTAMIGKYLNGYANQPAIPSGWSEWHAVAPNWVKAYDYTVNDNGSLAHHGRDPADYEQDVLTSKAVDFVDRRAPRTQPFFLWLTYQAPHTAGPNPNPNPPGDCGDAAKPAPRHAHAFDSEPLPRPPDFNEADVSDKPTEIRNRSRFTPSEIVNIQRKYRCSLESLVSVDDGVEKVVRRPEGDGRAGRHARRLRLRQRLLLRRAPDLPGQAAHLRGIDSRAVRDARPRHPAGYEGRLAGDQRRPCAHDRRRGERKPRAAWRSTGDR